MARQVASVESMPRAARATPYIPADLREMNMIADNRTTGMMTDCEKTEKINMKAERSVISLYGHDLVAKGKAVDDVGGSASLGGSGNIAHLHHHFTFIS